MVATTFVFTAYFFMPNIKNTAASILLNTASKIDFYLGIGDYFKDKKELLLENTALKQKVELLKYSEINRLAMEADLNEIKSLISNENEGGADKKDGVLQKKYGQIVRIEPQVAPRVNYLILERRPDSSEYFVFGKNSFLIATLAAGTRKEARLFSAHRKVTPAYILQDEEKIKISLKGMGAGAFSFDLNKEYKIKEGDIVLYKSFPIAIVRKVEIDEKSPYMKVYASVPFNLNNLDFVLLKKI